MEISSPYLSLRTFRKNGKPIDTPVWFAPDGPDRFYLFSAADAGKVKRIRNNSSAELASCDMRGGSLGQWHGCVALLVDDSQEIDRAYELLLARYGWQMRLTNFFSGLSGRINNRAVIRLELK